MLSCLTHLIIVAYRGISRWLKGVKKENYYIKRTLRRVIVKDTIAIGIVNDGISLIRVKDLILRGISIVSIR